MAEVVAQRLRTAIVDGQLPAGTPLRLAEVSNHLGVSVMPVRDALRQLEAERLVVNSPRRGATVSELSIEDAEETYAVRLALEALAARHAATRLTDTDVAEMHEAFERMASAQRAGDLRAFIEADHSFHERLYQASQRERLIRSISDLVDRSRRYSPYVYKSWLPLDNALAAHRPILDAVDARDADLVERLTHEHIATAATRLMSAIQHEVDERGQATEPLGRPGANRRERRSG